MTCKSPCPCIGESLTIFFLAHDRIVSLSPINLVGLELFCLITCLLCCLSFLFSRKAGWSFSTSLPFPTSFNSITPFLFHRQRAILMGRMWETANHVMLFCHVSSRLTILRRIFLTSPFCHVCSPRVGLVSMCVRRIVSVYVYSSSCLTLSSICSCVCVHRVGPVLCIVCLWYFTYITSLRPFLSLSILVDPHHLPQHGLRVNNNGPSGGCRRIGESCVCACFCVICDTWGEKDDVLP